MCISCITIIAVIFDFVSCLSHMGHLSCTNNKTQPIGRRKFCFNKVTTNVGDFLEYMVHRFYVQLIKWGRWSHSDTQCTTLLVVHPMIGRECQLLKFGQAGFGMVESPQSPLLPGSPSDLPSTILFTKDALDQNVHGLLQVIVFFFLKCHHQYWPYWQSCI